MQSHSAKISDGSAGKQRIRPAAALAAAAAHPAWLDVWAAVWGMLLAQPDTTIGETLPKVAAVGVIVWLLTWSRGLEDPAQQLPTASIPGGRGALAVAALAVSAVLGPGPLVACAIWLAVGSGRRASGARSGEIADLVRAWVGALGAWLSIGGGAVAAAQGSADLQALVPFVWVQRHGVDVALILAGTVVAVGSAGTFYSAADRARPASGIARGAAFVALVIGLTAADRPIGLWLVALCAAALWFGRSRFARDGAAGSARTWLPFALGAVCIVDRIMP